MNVKIYLKSKKNSIDATAVFDTDTKEVIVKKGSFFTCWSERKIQGSAVSGKTA